jgi:hypothetical protein
MPRSLTLTACVASGQHAAFLASGTYHEHAPGPARWPGSADLAAMRQAIDRQQRGPRQTWAYAAWLDGHESQGIGWPDDHGVDMPAPDDLPDRAGEPHGVGAAVYVTAPAGAWWAWLTRAAREDRQRAYEAHGSRDGASTPLDLYSYSMHPLDCGLPADIYPAAWDGEAQRGCPAGWKAGAR